VARKLYVLFVLLGALFLISSTIIDPEVHAQEPKGRLKTLKFSGNFERIDIQPAPVSVLADSATSVQTHAVTMDESQVGLQTANFEVQYIGFPTEAISASDHALTIWGSIISSSVPIQINAFWTQLEPGQLYRSYPVRFVRDIDSDLLFPSALANSLLGYDTYPFNVDIVIELNSDVDWYFGTDANPAANKFDLTTAVLGAVSHGLGFYNSFDVANSIGSWGIDGYPTVYDYFVANGSGQFLIDDFTNPSVSLATQLQSDNLFFASITASDANGGSPPKLYGPNPWEPGMSVTFLDEETYSVGTFDSLISPIKAPREAVHHPGPIALGILTDIGWIVTDEIISGKVIDFGDKPLKNVQVELSATPAGGHLDGEVTDKNGTFMFVNLVFDGQYFVRINSQGAIVTDPSVGHVTVPPGTLGLILKETAAIPCEEIVSGIQLCETNEQHTAIIDLDNEDIQVELATHITDQDAGLFELKTVGNLVSDDSNAALAGLINHPYIAINGTAFSEPVSDLIAYISDDSIFSIDGKPYGFECGTTDSTPPAEAQKCFHATAVLTKPTSFLTYSETGMPEGEIYRAEVNYAKDPNESLEKRREDVFNATSNKNFAVGYESTLLDAHEAGQQDGDKIQGFPEYVPNPSDHSNRRERTAIGVSCDGKRLFLSTVLLKERSFFNTYDTSTARWVRDMYKQGACRIIMLDGGGSSQFSGIWEEDRIDLSGVARLFCDGGGFAFLCPPRPTINAIVAYNKSISRISLDPIYVEGGSLSPSPQITINFAPNTFNKTVNLRYAPTNKINTKELLDVGIFWFYAD
jgi:hypothetical protein